MPAPFDLRRPTGPSRATTSFEALLWLYPDVALATWTGTPGRAIVDLLRVPEHRRRQGVGTMIYRSWERRLVPGTVVELFAVDAVARAFWSSLGFADIGDGGMEKLLHVCGATPAAMHPA
jgi:GNAT superfamily N-acetyltransferase